MKKFWYWRTLDNKYEVDLVIGDAEVAIEIKASNNISSKDTKGLRIFGEEHPEAKLFLISMENAPRKQDGVEFWNIEDFLRRLWKGQIL